MTDTAAEKLTVHHVQPLDGRMEVAARFADVARELTEQPGVAATLDAIVQGAVAEVPGARWVSITSVRNGRLQTVAATDERLRRADELQQAAGEGPCLETLAAGRIVCIADLATTDRYPVLGPQLGALGLRSAVAVQLFAGDRRLGAINLFGDAPDAFDDEAVQLAAVFSTHAAVALAGAQKEEQLTVAVETRDLIGQAKGILMERYKIDSDAAFALLVRGSQNTHRKLRDVAEELTRTGVDPH